MIRRLVRIMNRDRIQVLITQIQSTDTAVDYMYPTDHSRCRLKHAQALNHIWKESVRALRLVREHLDGLDSTLLYRLYETDTHRWPTTKPGAVFPFLLRIKNSTAHKISIQCTFS